MKSTGVIRRIDELGRIVIPKDIRKNLRIKTSDSLEIFINDNDIILKKYSFMNKINDLAQTLTDAVYTFMKHTIFITDTDNIIAASGPLKKDYIGKHISNFLEDSIMRREKLLQNHFKNLRIIDDKEINCTYVTTTIISSGEAVGMIIILDTEEKIGEMEMQIANIISSFITKYLES